MSVVEASGINALSTGYPGRSATRTCIGIRSLKGVMQGEALPGMTTPDDQKRTADELKELLRVAWSNVANPLLTPSERSEARNQIRRYGAELRRYLQPTGAEHSRRET
jgi:hypothetical protein